MADRFVGRVIAQAVLDARQYQQGLQSMQQQTQGAVRGLQTTFAGLQGTLAGLGVTLGAGLIAREIVTITSGVDRARLAMTRFVGTAAGARELEGQIRKLATTIGVDYVKGMEQANRLMVGGLGADQATRALRDFNDAAAGDPEKIQRLTAALSQMFSKGKVSAEELTQQMGELIPASRYVAEGMGISTRELAKQMAQPGGANVTPQQASQYIMKGIERDFGGLSEQFAKTFGGQLQILVQQLKMLGETIGRSVVPLLSGFATASNAIFGGLQKLNPSLATGVIQTIALTAALGYFTKHARDAIAVLQAPHIDARNAVIARNASEMAAYENYLRNFRAGAPDMDQHDYFSWRARTDNPAVRPDGTLPPPTLEPVPRVPGTASTLKGEVAGFLAANGPMIAFAAVTLAVTTMADAARRATDAINAEVAARDEARVKKVTERQALSQLYAYDPNDPSIVAKTDAERKKLRAATDVQLGPQYKATRQSPGEGNLYTSVIRPILATYTVAALAGVASVWTAAFNVVTKGNVGTNWNRWQQAYAWGTRASDPVILQRDEERQKIRDDYAKKIAKEKNATERVALRDERDTKLKEADEKYLIAATAAGKKSLESMKIPGLGQTLQEAKGLAVAWKAHQQGIRESAVDVKDLVGLVMEYRDAVADAAAYWTAVGGAVKTSDYPALSTTIVSLQHKTSQLRQEMAGLLPTDPSWMAKDTELKQLNTRLSELKAIADEAAQKLARVNEAARAVQSAGWQTANAFAVSAAAVTTTKVLAGLAPDFEATQLAQYDIQRAANARDAEATIGKYTRERAAALQTIAKDETITEAQRAEKIAAVTAQYDELIGKKQTDLALTNEQLAQDEERLRAAQALTQRHIELLNTISQVRQAGIGESARQATAVVAANQDTARTLRDLATSPVDQSLAGLQLAATQREALLRGGRATDWAATEEARLQAIDQLRTDKRPAEQIAAAQRLLDTERATYQLDSDRLVVTDAQLNALKDQTVALKNQHQLLLDNTALGRTQADSATNAARRAADLQTKARRANPLAELFGGPWRDMTNAVAAWQDANTQAARKEADAWTQAQRDVADAQRDGKTPGFIANLWAKAQDAVGQIRYELADKGIDLRLNLAKSSLEAMTQNIRRYVEKSGLFDRAFQQGFGKAVDTMGALIPQSYGSLPVFGASQLPQGKGQATIVIQLQPGLEGKLADNTLQQLNTVLQQSQQGLPYAPSY